MIPDLRFVVLPPHCLEDACPSTSAAEPRKVKIRNTVKTNIHLDLVNSCYVTNTLLYRLIMSLMQQNLYLITSMEEELRKFK